MSKNIKFVYLYRDGGNYKFWGEIGFKNPTGLTVSEIDARVRIAVDQEIFFIANEVEVNELFPYLDGDLTEDDHCYHEYYSVEETMEKMTDQMNRTILGFLKQIEGASKSGWHAFNPKDRCFSNIHSNS